MEISNLKHSPFSPTGTETDALARPSTRGAG